MNVIIVRFLFTNHMRYVLLGSPEYKVDLEIWRGERRIAAGRY